MIEPDFEKAICPFPFTQLFLHPDGIVSPCCWLHDYPLGRIQDSSLNEIWNGNPLRELRKEFLSGNPKICQPHIRHSLCNRSFGYLDPLVEKKEILPFPPKRLDLMLNGHCNLECIMCDVWKSENGVYTENGFWEEAGEKIFPFLKEIDVKGGEPFIQKDVFRLIDELSEVNPSCVWQFTTNGHYKFTDKIASKLDKIEILLISVSIDSLIPETYSKIRLKGALQTVTAMLDDLLAYNSARRKRKPFAIHCNLVLQKDNFNELPDFVEFCRKRGMGLNPITLTNPFHLSILDFPAEKRAEIARFYLESCAGQINGAYLNAVRPLMNSLSSQRRLELVHLLPIKKQKP